VAIADDAFRVFISHKHEDHALAVEVKSAVEGLDPELIDCFVSGVDIAAGADWRREIRTALAESHLLVLLFTTPTKNWDWCLYETGLYTRFDLTEPRSVACLFAPGQGSPSPLADLQGVPVDVDRLGAFLDSLCRRTWEASDDWRRGPLAPEIAPDRVEAAARAIVEGFQRSGSTSTHYPCHRLVLSFSESDDFAKGIPESARVVVGPSDTSEYTLSLFDLAGGGGTRSWGDLLAAVDGAEADWRRELDSHFLRAVDEQLFPPVEGRMRCAGASRAHERLYRPILYSIVRGPTVARTSGDSAEPDQRPRSVTIVLDPEPPAPRETGNG
jgi:hypothetical protein